MRPFLLATLFSALLIGMFVKLDRGGAERIRILDNEQAAKLRKILTSAR